MSARKFLHLLVLIGLLWLLSYSLDLASDVAWGQMPSVVKDALLPGTFTQRLAAGLGIGFVLGLAKGTSDLLDNYKTLLLDAIGDMRRDLLDLFR